MQGRKQAEKRKKTRWVTSVSCSTSYFLFPRNGFPTKELGNDWLIARKPQKGQMDHPLTVLNVQFTDNTL